MSGPYQFSQLATANPPTGDDIKLLEKAQRREKLTRDEKDRVAELLWGTFGAHSPCYKRAGWAWDMRTLPLILVKFKHDGRSWTEYRAPDKTSLRKALKGYGPILKMVNVEDLK